MGYAEFAPPPRLAHVVECFWSSQIDADRQHIIFPDGCSDVIFSPGRGARAVGVMNYAQTQELAAGDYYVGVRFHPGAARACIGVPSHLLMDQTIPIDDIWGARGRQLCERIASAVTLSEQLELLAAALPTLPAVPQFWPVLAVDSVDTVASRAGCSSRQLRRRCLEETGLSPKRLARILRFRRAVQLAQGTDPDWSGIAAECGYFDQAHLIRDFREFAGGPPTSVFSNRS